MIQFRLENIQLAASRMGEMQHLDALACIPEYFRADVDNRFSKKEGAAFKAAVFNMEQGTRIEKIIPFFQSHPGLMDVDVILANELDAGMRRSGNLDTTRELAKALQMNYAYGIEFITTKAGQEGNTQGLHGNAIISKFPLSNVKIIHLPIQYDWFYMPGDSRLGTRNAVLAEIEPLPGRRVGLVSVHLENRATPQERLVQMEYLLREVEAHFGGLPVLIGGDMNTNTVSGNTSGSMDVFLNNEAEQQRRMRIIPELEPLMGHAEENRFSYKDCNIMEKPTRRKPMPDGSSVLLNLDWFFQRGLACTEPYRVETLVHTDALTSVPEALQGQEGFELSDHDAIVITAKLKE